MRRQLAVADAAGMPGYLESSKEINIPIYKSFGFEVTGEIKLAERPDAVADVASSARQRPDPQRPSAPGAP